MYRAALQQRKQDVASIALGALWEVVELAFGVVETRRNSIKDLLMDSIGAAVAAALVVWGMRRRCRRTP